MQQVAGDEVEVHGGIAYVPQVFVLHLVTAAKLLSRLQSQVLDASGNTRQQSRQPAHTFAW